MEHRSSYTAPRSSRGSASHHSASGGGPGRNGNGHSSKRNTYTHRSWTDNRFLFNLAFFILPFFVINGILFVLITSSPKIELTIADTKDYRTVDVSLKVKSILPLKEMSVTMESEPLEMEKTKHTYHAVLSENGTLEVNAKSLNGMTARVVEHVAALDDTPPSIDENDYIMENGILTITVDDSQSGINYSTIHATNAAGETVKPTEINKDAGKVTFDMDTDSLVIIVEDLAGNVNQATFSLVTSGIDTESRHTEFPTDGTNGTIGNVSEDDSKKSSSTKETAKGSSSTKETAKGSSSTKETAKGSSSTKETAKGSSSTKETTKSSSSTKETTKASSSTKETAKATTAATKETAKATTAATKETAKATTAATKETAKATTAATKETTKAATETTKAPETTAAAPGSSNNGPGGNPSNTETSAAAPGGNADENITIVPIG